MELLQNQDTPSVQSVQRALELLGFVAQQPARAVRLNDLVEMSGMSKPTVHRLLKQLVASGMLMQGSQRRYGLGPAAFELGIAAFRSFPLRDLADPLLEAQAHATGDSAFLVVRSGSDSLCISRKQGNYPVQVLTVDTGHRQPMGVGAGGLAMLSFLEPAETERCLVEIGRKLELRPYGGLNVPLLRELMDDTRKRGWARISHFAVPGVTGASVPLLNNQGYAFAAVTSGAIELRMTEQHLAETVAQLRGTARKLGDLLAKRN